MKIYVTNVAKRRFFLTAIFLIVFCSKVSATESEYTFLKERIDQHNRKNGNGSFERMFLECKSAYVEVEGYNGLDLSPDLRKIQDYNVSVDVSSGGLNCSQVLEIGDKYARIYGGLDFDAGRVNGSFSAGTSGVQGELGVDLFSASGTIGSEVGGIGSSMKGGVKVGLGVEGGASLNRKKDKTCLDVSAGGSIGVGGVLGFEFCLKDSWNPLSSSFWR